MAQRGAEDPGLLGSILTHPSDHRRRFGRLGLWIGWLTLLPSRLLQLFARGQYRGRREDLNVVV
ncbi:MAG: hypothetical protein EBU59_12395, partial [Planctomycetia bacterium]|nr:hypothetical protein [Planctomycetia bacterium]